MGVELIYGFGPAMVAVPGVHVDLLERHYPTETATAIFMSEEQWKLADLTVPRGVRLLSRVILTKALS